MARGKYIDNIDRRHINFDHIYGKYIILKMIRLHFYLGTFYRPDIASVYQCTVKSPNI